MQLLNSRLEEMLARDKSFSSAAGAALKEASEFLSQTGRDMRVSVENVNIFEEEEVCTAKKVLAAVTELFRMFRVHCAIF